MVRILVAVEEKYGVWMEPADLTPENLANVETMAESLHRLLVNQTPGS
jgi:acyl carrier protein